ncbi:MAG: ABC transporter permease, partial [Planctomycetaceae bacterium]|nr:ABC transporter permease [Planctomycetaceae bacterium]
MQQFSVNINPLLLRELRQQVRNRFIIVLINLYVAVLVLVCLMNVLFRQNAHEIHGGGGILFGGLAVTMGIACFLTVVIYTALTTASERINGDLMFTSGLKPATIVFGKALAGAILTILLMSITAPFVMVAYLLRGLDIEIVVITFIGIFTAIQVFNGMAICICSNIRTKIQMIAVLGGSFFVAIFGLQVLIVFTISYLWVGHRHTNWMELAALFLFAGMVFAIFLAGAITSIAPSTSNRLLPIRLTVTVIYLGSLLIALLVPSFFATSNSLVPWIYSWTVALAILMLMVVCERETWSVRIKRTLPKQILFRVLLFPFYTGAANGLIWLALLGLGLLFVVRSQTGESFDARPFYWLLFSFDYCVTAMFIRSCFFPKLVAPDKVLMIILF